MTRSMLNWLALESEKRQGRSNGKYFKVSRPRHGDEFEVSFYGYSAYLAVTEFERRLRETGIEWSRVHNGNDRVAAVTVKSIQGTVRKAIRRKQPTPPIDTHASNE